MTKPYPILPMSVTDELNNLNCALAAYDALVTAWLEQGDPAPPQFAAGVSHLLRPILEGYQDIGAQVEQFRKLGLVGVGHLGEPESE